MGSGTKRNIVHTKQRFSVLSNWGWMPLMVDNPVDSAWTMIMATIPATALHYAHLPGHKHYLEKPNYSQAPFHADSWLVIPYTANSTHTLHCQQDPYPSITRDL